MTALSGPARSQSVLAELNEAWRCLCCGFCKQVSSFGSWPKSNSHAVACPIRVQYAVQLRSLTALEGQPFSLHVRKLPSQSLSVLVFQAGHASSILVTRSSTSWPGQTGFRRTLTNRTPMVRGPVCPIRAHNSQRTSRIIASSASAMTLSRSVVRC
jgi:hypothetical protein